MSMLDAPTIFQAHTEVTAFRGDVHQVLTACTCQTLPDVCAVPDTGAWPHAIGCYAHV